MTNFLKKVLLRGLALLLTITLIPFFILAWIISKLPERNKLKQSNVVKGPGLFFLMVTDDKIFLSKQVTPEMEEKGYTWISVDFNSPFYIQGHDYNDMEILFVGAITNDDK